jgi:putative autoinducer-2 (AI-2) aldolase
VPEADGDAKDFYTDVPPPSDGFFLKGSGSLDWGMSNRLARVFRPETGRTVMLAIDHGYFQGPTTGLERVDVSILPWCLLRTRSCAREASSDRSFRPACGRRS